MTLGDVGKNRLRVGKLLPVISYAHYNVQHGYIVCLRAPLAYNTWYGSPSPAAV